MFQRLSNKVRKATRYHQKRQEREIANEAKSRQYAKNTEHRCGGRTKGVQN